jgi:hypothetical protein
MAGARPRSLDIMGRRTARQVYENVSCRTAAIRASEFGTSIRNQLASGAIFLVRPKREKTPMINMEIVSTGWL